MSESATVYTIPEVAGLLSISRSKLYELIRDQTMRSIKLAHGSQR